MSQCSCTISEPRKQSRIKPNINSMDCQIYGTLESLDKTILSFKPSHLRCTSSKYQQIRLKNKTSLITKKIPRRHSRLRKEAKIYSLSQKRFIRFLFFSINID